MTELADFSDFYRECRDDCLRAVVLSVGDRDAAQDLVAEAFARAWASWRTVGRHPTPAAWVVRTALNLNISWWRRRRREVLVPDIMNDDLMAAARDSFSGIEMGVPQEQIISRGRAVRARRRRSRLAAGALAGLAAGAIAVNALLPASQPARHRHRHRHRQHPARSLDHPEGCQRLGPCPPAIRSGRAGRAPRGHRPAS